MSSHSSGHHSSSHSHSVTPKAQVTPAMLTLLAVGAGVIVFLVYVTLYAIKTTPGNAFEMMQ